MTEEYTQEDARTKNREEYSGQADIYADWQANNICMQKLHYFTTFDQLRQEGVDGKTFLEVGCGTCPVGQRLVQDGAKKIYGLDISAGMLEEAKKELTEKGIADKFELICADIFDEDNF
jgi:ubiquinone/menaquinone biosynthesis C-methylase UbiE